MSLALLLIGLILMPNSPSPYPYPVDYTDFTATEIVETYNDSESEYTYTTTIENTGTGYISLNDTYLMTSANKVITKVDSANNYSSSEYLTPNNSLEVTFTIEGSFINPHLYCRAYLATSIATDATSSNYSAITKRTLRETDSYTTYSYSFSADSTYDNGYTYEVLINYTYDGVSKTVGTTDYSGENIIFSSSSDMDVSKMIVDSLVFIRGRSINYFDGDGWFSLISIVGIALIGLSGLIGLAVFGGIVALIVFLIVKAVKHSKNNVQK